MTDLIDISKMKSLAPATMASEMRDAFNGIFSKIEKEIADHVPDLKTETGRKRTASLAYDISRTKTAMDKAAADLVAEQKAAIDAVNGERKTMREELDRLRDKARAPLNEWEAEMKRRETVAKEQTERIAEMEELARDHDSEGIAAAIVSIETFEFDAVAFGDYLEGAERSRTKAIARLKDRHETVMAAEKDRAELEILRRERAEQEQKQAEIERKRVADEAAAKAAADEAARAERAAEQARKDADERARQQIQDAERRAAEAEANAKAEIERAEQARLQQIAAREAEENRLKANAEHRARIEDAAVAELTDATGMPNKWAVSAIAAISKGKVGSLTLDYAKRQSVREAA